MPPVFQGIDNKLEHIKFINPGPTCSSSKLSQCQSFFLISNVPYLIV